MQIALPGNFNRNTMYHFINQIIDNDLQPKDKEFQLDFNSLTFIEPVGFTVLSNVIEWLKKRGCSVSGLIAENISYRGRIHCPISFLDDSLFFDRYVGQKIFAQSSPRDTTIPLSIIAHQKSAQWLEKTIQWLARRLSMKVESLTNIKVCFEEVFNNIKDHSNENIGCIFAQHFPNKNIVRVAISDFGVGIPFNVQKVKPLLTDSQAIRQAIVYGFTTKSNVRNGGRGLDTLIQNVVKNNQGSVYIHSTRGILESTYLNGEINSQEKECSGFYPGTLLDIVFRTDTIEDYEDEEDFLW